MKIKNYKLNSCKIELFNHELSLPKWARSDILNRSFQFATPRDSFFWISSNNSGRLTTQPFPKQTKFLRNKNKLESQTNYINTIFKMKTRWKHMKVIFSSIDNDTMTCIVSSLIKLLFKKKQTEENRFDLLDIDKRCQHLKLINPQVCLCPIQKLWNPKNETQINWLHLPIVHRVRSIPSMELDVHEQWHYHVLFVWIDAMSFNL